MGDGILVLFGYPHAHEDDPVRALHAGLDIIEAIENLDHQYYPQLKIHLQVRIGVATGLVVAGDLIGKGAAEEQAVYGETPNLAARLQSHAIPGSMLVSEITHDLTNNHFNFDFLGCEQLKGIAQAVKLFQVKSVVDAKLVKRSTSDQEGIRLVGREAEMALLLNCWERAKAEHDQLILLSAEAGIGKSSLVNAFKRELAADSATRIFYYCSPYNINSAYFPIIERLQRAAGIKKRNSAAEKIDKIKRFLKLPNIELKRALPAIAALLSVPYEQDSDFAGMSPVEQKREILSMLIEIVKAMSQGQALYLIIEDIHWIDPSTLEFIHHLIDAMRDQAFLLVLTSRPEIDLAQMRLNQAMMLQLNRLSKKQSIDVIHQITGGKQLPDEALERVLAKTDGVPLFIEEFTRSLLESGQLVETGSGFEMEAQLTAMAVPTSIQDSMAARLDRQPNSKSVVQQASVIGRRFSFDLLLRLTSQERNHLRETLDNLVTVNVLVRRGMEEEAIYEFRHALLRDAAYQSLLNTERKRIHTNLASLLIAEQAEVVKMQPEIIAQHLTEGGDYVSSLDYWYRAGERSKFQSANVEAIAHFNQGIKIIKQMPEGGSRDRRELEFFMALGPALMATRGFAVSEVEEAYERGLELANQVGTTEQIYTVTWGSWLFRQQRGEMDVATHLADELLTLSEHSDDGGVQLQANHAAWTTALRIGKFAECCEYAEQGVGLYQTELHRDMAFVFGGHDPGVCALQHSAISRWILGYPEQAARYKNRLLEHIEHINHPFSSALAKHFAAMVNVLMNLYEETAELAKKTIETCDMYGVAPQYRNSSLVFLGWAQYAAGNTGDGLHAMRSGLDIHRKAPARAHEPFLITMLATASLEQGLIDEASALVGEGLEQIERTGELTWKAELMRLDAELMLVDCGRQADGSERLRQAIAVAQSQNARSLELRAAISLARYYAKRDEADKGIEVLQPLHLDFTEGHASADLVKSAQLLADLNHAGA
jgi:predicted ATPase